MDGQDVHLVGAHEAVDDAVRSVNNLADERIRELRNGSPGFRELRQAFGEG